jgi:hypothetical protein
MISDGNRSCPYHWVVSAYAPNSDRGKSVLAHAEIGLGYVLQNRNRSKNDNIIVAFKYPAHQALKNNLQYATPEQTYVLEERYGSK